MASAIAQLIAQQRGPDIMGATGRAVQTAGAIEQLKSIPIQQQLQQQQLTLGQRQLAQADAATAEKTREQGLAIMANTALELKKLPPEQRAQAYQQIKSQVERTWPGAHPWPTEYNEQVQGMLDFADAQVNGAKRFETDEAIRKEDAKTTGPVSTVGKLMADKEAARKAGADAAALKAYDDAIAKVGQGNSVNVSIVDGQQALTKTNTTKVQENIMNLEQSLSNLDSIANRFSGDYLTYQGRVKAGAGRLLDKAGMENDLTQMNSGRAKFRNEVNQFFNQYRKDITGAAASEKELEQLKDSILNEDMGPAEFKAAYDQFVTKIKKNLELNKRNARQGVEVEVDEQYKNMSDDELKKALGL